MFPDSQRVLFKGTCSSTYRFIVCSTNLSSSVVQFVERVLISWQLFGYPEWSWDGRLHPSSLYPNGQHFLLSAAAYTTATLLLVLTFSDIVAMRRLRGFLFPRGNVTIYLGQPRAHVCSGKYTFFKVQFNVPCSWSLSYFLFLGISPVSWLILFLM